MGLNSYFKYLPPAMQKYPKVLFFLILLFSSCQPEVKVKYGPNANADRIDHISVGFYHSCGLLAGETSLKCWGMASSDGWSVHPLIPSATAPSVCLSTNQAPQANCYSTPVEITGLPSGTITQVITGLYHTCVLVAGKVYCWGIDTMRSVGVETATDACTVATGSRCLAVPSEVSFPGSPTITSLATGGLHTCAKDNQGQIYCWGWNVTGQLGYVSTDDDCTAMGAVPPNTHCQTTPQKISGITGVEKIYAGFASTCYLKSGAIKCLGAIGDWSTTSSTFVSIHPDFDSGVVDFVVGSEFYCARKSNGNVHCFGNNATGGLGDGTTTDNFATTAGSTNLVSGVSGGSIQGPPGFAVFSSSNNICSLKNGGVTCWGFNNGGALGPTVGIDITTPTAIAPLSSGVTKMAVGLLHSCFIKDRKIYCIGSNDLGELGNNGQASGAFVDTPVEVSWP